jgi:hypothetical protein
LISNSYFSTKKEIMNWTGNYFCPPGASDPTISQQLHFESKCFSSCATATPFAVRFLLIPDGKPRRGWRRCHRRTEQWRNLLKRWISLFNPVHCTTDQDSCFGSTFYTDHHCMKWWNSLTWNILYKTFLLKTQIKKFCVWQNICASFILSSRSRMKRCRAAIRAARRYSTNRSTMLRFTMYRRIGNTHELKK